MRKFLGLLLLSVLFILPLLSGIAAGEEVDESQFQPLLVIERINAEKALAGSHFYLTLVIKNYSDHPAFNVIASVDALNEKEKIFSRDPQPGRENPDLQKIDGGETRSLTFAVNVSKDAESKNYNLLITLESENVFFSPAPRSSANITVNVEVEATAPNITVSRVTLDPKTPARGEPFTAVFYLDNYSSREARNVNITIEGQENFEVLDFTNRKFLQSISKGAGNFVLFKLREIEGRKGNNVLLKFTYEYPGSQVPSTLELRVNLPLDLADPRPGAAPLLKVSSFTLENTQRKREKLLKIVLENLGQEKAKEIGITLDGGNSLYVIGTSNVDYLSELEGQEKIKLEYLLGINYTRGTTYYPLKLAMDYSDSRGKEYSTVETLGIHYTEEDEETLGGGKPRVLISKYTLSEEKILAGNAVTLTLFIENTHVRPVQNMKVSLGVFQVEGTGAGGSGGGTVFSPVGGSNSFFIRSIPPGATVKRSIDLYVDPNAAAKTYIVPVKIEYEDENAEAYQVDEMVNIPVTQESRLQVLSIEVPPVAYVGQPAFVSAEFVNVGKVDLGNFIVMMEGNFPKEQASYFVGNLPIGASNFYQGIIYPDQEGILRGELIFSYIDNHNKEVQIVEPFEIEVMPMRPMEPYPGEMPPDFKERPQSGFLSRITGNLALIIPLVAAATGGIIYLRRRAIKKKNEEYLDA